MSPFYLTPASIGYLTQFILAVTITGYFLVRTASSWRRHEKTAPTLLLTCFFASTVAIILLFFLDAVLPPSPRLVAVYLENTVIGLFLILLIQFAYHFPRLYPRCKWEARLALVLGILYTLGEAGFAVYRGSLLLHSGQVLYRPLFADRALIVGFVWAPLAFVRQAVAASRDEQELAGVRNLPVLRDVWHLCRPQGQAARTVRAFALVFLLPVALSLVNFQRAASNISPAVFQPSMSAGILLTQFLFALVYLHSVREMTTFQVRLVGVTLVTVLAVFGAAGWVMTPPHAAVYRPMLADRQTLRFTPNDGGGYDVARAPFRFDTDLGTRLAMQRQANQATAAEELAEVAFTFPFYGQTRHTLWVMNGGLVSMDEPARFPSMEYRYATTPAIFSLFLALRPSPGGGVFARNDGRRLTITWSQMEADLTPQAFFTFQLVMDHDGAFEITTNGLPDLPYQTDDRPFNNVWVMGASPGTPGRPPQQVSFAGAPLQGGPQGMVQDHYLEFRRHVHQLLVPLAYLILVGSLFVVVSFPVLFQVNLVRPLNALLAGVRRVDAGDLEVSMPIQAQDEIGFLTRAFNGMVAALRSSIAGLEAQVSQRTQQLERQNAELAQAKALAEDRSQAAEAANRAKSVFLANMSHELRTPLNAVLGFAELVIRDPALTAEQRRNLERIDRSGQHLLHIINDVLHLSRIEAGRVEIQPESLDLHLLLLGLEEMFRLRAERKGLSLGFQVGAGVPRTVWADGGKLRQVLTNLLGNAVKFTPAGSVALRVRCDQDTSPGRPRLLFEVEDTGIGIAPDEIEAIFDPFVQTASGQQAGEGTGLGLSISREFVRLMGGTLRARSAGVPGQGSLFVFDLPLRPVEETPATVAARAGRPWAVALEPGQAGARILIVDDSQASRELLAELLQPLGLALREACDGQEAIAAWQAWRPHLILMDRRMPVLDGGEATRRIKALPGGRETVVVAVTASVFEENRAAVLAEGFDDLLHKPARLEEIVAALARHLDLRFVYSETPPAAEAPRGKINLGGLPAAWLAGLRQAALEADQARIATLAQEIRARQPEVAAALDQAGAHFDYGAVLDAAEREMGTAERQTANRRM